LDDKNYPRKNKCCRKMNKKMCIAYCGSHIWEFGKVECAGEKIGEKY
jgi:hypothetical protein